MKWLKFMITACCMLCTQHAQATWCQQGMCSWYGTENHRSCLGKKLDHYRPELAHKTLPMGTKVLITDVKTRKAVVAVVVDRGPYRKNRIADLNRFAAHELGIVQRGTAWVKLEVVDVKANHK